MAVDPRRATARAYLQRLAARLGLAPDTVAEIHRRLRAPQ
jgi:uncharacterized membrane protein YebE (DUF533 family)